MATKEMNNTCCRALLNQESAAQFLGTAASLQACQAIGARFVGYMPLHLLALSRINAVAHDVISLCVHGTEAANPALLDARTATRMTPLMLCGSHNTITVAETLIQAKADIGLTNGDGEHKKNVLALALGPAKCGSVPWLCAKVPLWLRAVAIFSGP